MLSIIKRITLTFLLQYFSIYFVKNAHLSPARSALFSEMSDHLYIKKSFCRNINFIILMILLGFLFACNSPNTTTNQMSVNGKSTNGQSDNNASSDKIQTVEVVNPQGRSFSADVLITGSVQPNQSVMVYAMESGLLSEIRKDIGDKVSSGEIIAKLKNPNITALTSKASSDLAVINAKIKTAQADLEAAKAEANGLQSIADRLTSIYEKTPQLTMISEVETAQANAAVAKAKIKSKEAYLLAQQESVKSMETSLQTSQSRASFLTIKAPFSGIITKRFVDKGSLLQSGLNQNNPQAIVEIQETDPVRITLPVPESDAVAIKQGMALTVSFPELSGAEYEATVTRTSGVLDPSSRTMQVEIDLENPDGKIITGMYAKAFLKVDSRENILSLPVKTKVKYKNEDYVLVVKDDKVERVPVKIGLSDKDYFEVLNADITAETKVITNGKGLVKPGQVVKGIFGR